MDWRIEAAPSARSTCRHCGKQIVRGEMRFGQDGRGADWFHVACAPLAKPRVWKMFTEDKSSADVAPVASVPEGPQASGRHAELEARLLAQPEDDAARVVFADWLQQQGDPWGELIVLARASSPNLAKHLKTHARSLIGPFGAKMFEWRGGFVHGLALDTVKPAQAEQILDEVLALRTTFLVRDMNLPVRLEVEVARALSRAAPRALVSLFCWYGDGLADLSIPSLQRLTCFLTSTPRAAALTSFFDGTGLPALRELEILDRPLPLVFLDALLDSALLRRLEALTLGQRTLDGAAADRILERQSALSHLPRLSFAIPASHGERFASVFGQRLSSRR